MRAFRLLPALVQPAKRGSARTVALQADEEHVEGGETLGILTLDGKVERMVEGTSRATGIAIISTTATW